MKKIELVGQDLKNFLTKFFESIDRQRRSYSARLKGGMIRQFGYDFGRGESKQRFFYYVNGTIHMYKFND